jgi:hypothetical protein
MNKTELEAATFRRLLQHLDQHKEVKKYRPNDSRQLLSQLPEHMVYGRRTRTGRNLRLRKST